MFTISQPWDISCLSSFCMVEQRQKEIHSTTLHEYQAENHFLAEGQMFISRFQSWHSQLRSPHLNSRHGK